MAVSFVRCDSDHVDFVYLIKKLDVELAALNGAQQAGYDPYNWVPGLKTAMVAAKDGVPVGCGCFKEYGGETVELKRVFVLPEHRGKGIASQLIGHLEGWAKDLGYCKAVLETGRKQTEAIRLYGKCGYQITENYGPYAGMENSVCFAKKLV